MKKEWLFFCVFFISVICPSVSRSQIIVKFTCTAVNNTVATPFSVNPDQLITAGDSLENNSSYTIVSSVKLSG
jgi:hypothetical protein